MRGDGSNIELAVLRRGLNLALEAGKISLVPKVKSLQLRNTRKGFFEHSEFVAILAHLPIELMPLMRVAYITGWRIGELLSRQKRHVDLDAGFLRLDPGETKNGDGRMFPLTSELRSAAQHGYGDDRPPYRVGVPALRHRRRGDASRSR